MSLSVTEALLIVIRMQHVSTPLEVMGVYAILGTLEMDSHVWVRLSAAIVDENRTNCSGKILSNS